MLITQGFKEELLSKVNIVDVVSRFVTLTKKGGQFWACCPFHGEKTPSFSVKADEGFFYCFGCHKSGDAISFIMEIKRLSYPEAIRFLADLVGLKVPEEEESEEVKRARARRDTSFKILSETAKFYAKSLFTDGGAKALEYLAKRGINQDSLKAYGLGASPDYDSLPNHLRSLGFNDADMVTAGVVGKKSDPKGDRIYDFLAGRLIVPIIGPNGQVLAFGGRLLEKADFAKYVNTTNTNVFDKHKNLFSLNNAKVVRLPYFILVEGYFDVITLYQAGFKNAVAPMGTALGDEQARIIRKYVPTVYVCFDGDSAGIKAAVRSLEILRNADLEIKVITLPNNEDPDDYIRNHGDTAFQKEMDNARPYVDYVLWTIEKGVDIDTPEGKKNYARCAVDFLATLDELTAFAYTKTVSSVSQISINHVEDALQKKRGARPVVPHTAEQIAPAKPPIEEVSALDAKGQKPAEIKASRYVIGTVLLLKDFVDVRDISPDLYVNPKHLDILLYIKTCVEEGRTPSVAELFLREELVPELQEIIAEVKGDPKESVYHDCIMRLKKFRRDARIEEIKELRLKATGDERRALEEELLKLIKIK